MGTWGEGQAQHPLLHNWFFEKRPASSLCPASPSSLLSLFCLRPLPCLSFLPIPPRVAFVPCGPLSFDSLAPLPSLRGMSPLFPVSGALCPLSTTLPKAPSCTHTHTDTQTHTHTDMDTHIDTTQTHRYTHTDTQTQTHTHRHGYTHRHTHSNTHQQTQASKCIWQKEAASAQPPVDGCYGPREPSPISLKLNEQAHQGAAARSPKLMSTVPWAPGGCRD